MTEGKKTLLLKGNVQHYDWGGTEFIPSLLGIGNKDKKPFAEYWMGAHEKSSSLVQLTANEFQPLHILIKQNPNGILGNYVADKFHRLPYLLKILDVKDMLSIQVHPAKESAEREFERENMEGIPTDAPNRNYKDNNHKPELIVALSDFWLLHGFKQHKELGGVLEKIPEFRSIFERFNKSGLTVLYETIMNMPQHEVNNMLHPLLQRIIPLYQRGELHRDSEDFWAARAALNFNKNGLTDRGIFSIYFLNLLKIIKGEGIFQAIGVPHAYLEGQNVEIMANSDNVLRGGLTIKHVDVKELIKQIHFEETSPVIIRPFQVGTEAIYKTPVSDFQLSYIVINPKENISFATKTAEIFFVLKGNAGIFSTDSFLDLKKGQSAIVFADQTIQIKSESGAGIFKASVPVPQPG